MILNYKDIEHEYLSDYTKKDIEIKAFTAKDFDYYKDEMEQKGQIVTVVRNTTLKEISDDSDDVKRKEYLEINGKKYQLKKESVKAAVGYIPIDETRFVRIESNLLLFILLGGAGIALITLGLIFIPKLFVNDDPIIHPDIEMDDNANDWDGTGNDGGQNSVAEQENTIIPGFSTFKATKESCLIKLYNFPENTVNFVYTITKPIKSEKVQTFEKLDDAQKYVTKNTINYSNYYDETTKNYLLKDGDGNLTDVLIEYKIEAKNNTFEVYRHESEVIYFTKGIAPNQSIDWNAYDGLGAGEHKVQFRISTYDVSSNAACYGAIQDVKITIIE